MNFEFNHITHKNYVIQNDEKVIKPLVMIVPEWWGISTNIINKANALAKLGFIAFAVDLYGEGKVVHTPDEAGKLATPFYQDPKMSYSIFSKALETAKTIPNVDVLKIAAIGFCFGGGNLINYIRQGLKINGVVSFHGALNGGLMAQKDHVYTPMLILNGEIDSMVPMEDREQFKKEMTEANAIFTFIDYPNATHAFTNPDATAVGEKYGIDIAYQKEADEASWLEMLHFFKKVF